jgi:2',3'-cyclic-nucleotide 2'-phosphodiesterase (5'-nucleotidase family)
MKQKIVSLWLAFVMAFALAFTAFAAQTDENLTGTVVILHTNDVHGEIAGYAKVAALKKEYESKGAYVLLLDAGDYIQGDPAVSISMGKSAIEMMNLAGYDAAIPGNHEFDYGYENLIDVMKNAEFTPLSANLTYNGQTFFKENVIFTSPEGKKIGVFGLTTPETATKAHPAKIRGVGFQAGQQMYAAADAQVQYLKAQGCDLIVCLAHLGIDNESEPNRSIDLLNKVSGIDILIDGHSHSTLDEVKAAVGADSKVGSTVITSTGTKLSNIGVIEVKTDGSITAESVSTDTLSAEDPATAARAAAIQQEIDRDYSTVFATTQVQLNGERDPGNRTEETNLGDLITDALVWGAEKNGESVDGAIFNGGGIRASIAAGNITKKDINTVLPFGNSLSIIKLTGSELLEALEASTYCTPEALGGFPQSSGIVYTLDTTVPYDQGAQYPGSTYYGPASIRRVSIQSVGGRPFDANAIYTIATNDFLAAGGDTYYAFSSASVNYDLGLVIDEVVMDYVKSALNGVVTQSAYGAPKGRITIKAAAVEDTETAESAEVTAEETAIPVSGNTYVVRPGDALWNIARQFYGSGNLWTAIYEANKQSLKDPNRIYAGQLLVIPAM